MINPKPFDRLQQITSFDRLQRMSILVAETQGWTEILVGEGVTGFRKDVLQTTSKGTSIPVRQYIPDYTRNHNDIQNAMLDKSNYDILFYRRFGRALRDILVRDMSKEGFTLDKEQQSEGWYIWWLNSLAKPHQLCEAYLVALNISIDF